MSETHLSVKHIAIRLLLFAGFAALLVSAQPAPAQTFSILHNFTSPGECPGLVMDAAGNLYGAAGGGTYGLGEIYQLTLSGGFTTLHSFSGGADGVVACSKLAIDAQGNLYGASNSGGTNGGGDVFKLTPAGDVTVLYNFPATPDLYFPDAGLALDSSNNIYGTREYGGNFGAGTAFEVTPSGGTILHNFGSAGDGKQPRAGVVADANGNVYGTTYHGGTGKCGTSLGCGTVFEIASGGTSKILHSFDNRLPLEGKFPWADLLLDSQGNIYGTTYKGGDRSIFSQGYGTVFKIAPDGTETILRAFAGRTFGDGCLPLGGMVMDGQGNLFGTTWGCGIYGGLSKNGGVVFEIISSGIEKVLYNFNKAKLGAFHPEGDLVMDAQGNLYGTASGGAYGFGVVFKVTP
jgi:uncharacterized repeat protein (TIGR03803 family)